MQRTIRTELYGYVRCADTAGVMKRIGVGRLRQTDSGLLWVQQVHDDMRLAYTKEIGHDKEAYMFDMRIGQGDVTKHRLNERGEMMGEHGEGDDEQLEEIDMSVSTWTGRKQVKLGLRGCRRWWRMDLDTRHLKKNARADMCGSRFWAGPILIWTQEA